MVDYPDPDCRCHPFCRNHTRQVCAQGSHQYRSELGRHQFSGWQGGQLGCLDSNIDVDNYLVFSLVKAELEGKKRVLSVGALNHVWVLFEKRDLEGLIDTEVNTLWQNFVGSIPGFSREESRTSDVAVEKADESQTTAPLDSNTTVRKSANDIIDNAIEDVSSEVEKALERGVSKAIDGILKDLLGTGTGSGQ